MFGISRKNQWEHTVTVEDKMWIENNFTWMIETFGLEHLINCPFLLPDLNTFPYNDLKDPVQFDNLFTQLCGYWKINPDECIVQIFDDYKTRQWSTWIHGDNDNWAAGMFKQLFTVDEKRFRIDVARSNFDTPQLLINVLMHELTHVKMLGGNYVNRNDPDMEPLTDLGCIFIGMGLFLANTHVLETKNWISRIGYLEGPVISYANALLCYITRQKPDHFYQHLNTNTRALFKQDYEYLINTNDTLLYAEKVEQCVALYNLNGIVTKGFLSRQFDEVIGAAESLMKLNPGTPAYINYKGYALLQKKEYLQAIDVFTLAIDIDPYWSYAYNNRGYCKLQLGDMDNAFADIYSAFQMKQSNSFAWRNLGAYYLKSGDAEKALEHFRHAEQLDPATELINFYLAQANNALGKTEDADKYLKKSAAINEYNDGL